MMMRIHVLIHAEFEGPGMIEAWAKEKNYIFTRTALYAEETLPTIDEFDFLISLGGPQSAITFEQWPYLSLEVKLLQEAVQANKTILGICLGAQLLAQSLGARAERSPEREIGMFPIELLPAAAEDPLFKQFPSTFPVMHWHNDMPGLPQNARWLAKSAGCHRQAFVLGDRIYGLQFHLEMTRNDIQGMLASCKNEWKTGTYIESAAALLKHDLTAPNQKMRQVLEYLSAKSL